MTAHPIQFGRSPSPPPGVSPDSPDSTDHHVPGSPLASPTSMPTGWLQSVAERTVPTRRDSRERDDWTRFGPPQTAFDASTPIVPDIDQRPFAHGALAAPQLPMLRYAPATMAPLVPQMPQGALALDRDFDDDDSVPQGLADERPVSPAQDALR